MRYKTMIFDIDGTLTDSAAAILYALKQAVLKITGKDYDEKELRFALGVPSHLAMKKLTGEHWVEAMAIGQNYYQEGLKNIHLSGRHALPQARSAAFASMRQTL